MPHANFIPASSTVASTSIRTETTANQPQNQSAEEAEVARPGIFVTRRGTAAGAARAWPSPSSELADPMSGIEVAAGLPHAQLPLSEKFTRVHDICLEATKKYLDERQINRQMRFSTPAVAESRSRPRQNPQRHSKKTYAVPYSPYEAAQQRHRQSIEASSAHDGMTGFADASTGSLLSDVSRICDGVWAQSRRDRLHVPGTERTAVLNMAHLIEWAETIVWTSGDVAVGDIGREPAIKNIFAAGKNLCAWLGDVDGREIIEALEF
ncbi:hypothetical protein Cob_v012116 [Colletotrichum orbiculare MAFF 240422]|uniref:Uncharacterized protein n=1 Tax=Colletotrichum orbiculare (strain 104-T / ATCC 96160 / CBS 514.97 / LARS 414 / MAFF 240422) TaxID=1213857 RepID=A0A484FAF2_COLOR|nr:hypothetical protein Cob_v012116 [Colletotrichum orbiculare MAFF 240422]